MRLGACAWLMATVVILLFVIGALSVASAADDSEFRPLDEFEAEDEWTFHTYLGVVLFILYLALIIIPRLSGRIPVVTTAVSRFGAKLEELATPKRKWWTMLTLGAMALYAYGYCHHICEKGGVPIFDCNIIFFHLLFRFSLALFPYFIGGCIVGGVIMKYFSTGRLTIPDSMLGSSVIAALIPVCACGAIPLVKALLSTGQLRVRTVISFLIVVPVLSPFVIFFSFQLGAVYVATRIIAIFVLAMVGGVVIERFVGVEAAEPSSCFLACKGCMRSQQSGNPDDSSSTLMLAWDMMLFLLPYIVVGILIGAAIAKYAPAALVSTYLSSDLGGLITATAISLPLFLCSGQEVLILAPLMNTPLMGANALPVGHAIAFTIAGTGICLASIPALIPTIGKRAVAALVTAFLLGSILMGLVINSVMGLLVL